MIQNLSLSEPQSYGDDPWQDLENLAYHADGEPDVSLDALLQRAQEAIAGGDLATDEGFQRHAVRHLLEIIQQKVK